MSWSSMIFARSIIKRDPSLHWNGADYVELTSKDQAQIHQLRRRQLHALRTRDAKLAFELSSPSVQASCQTPCRYQAYMDSGYGFVGESSDERVGPIVITPHGLGQYIELDPDQASAIGALYLLERQHDGSWKNSGIVPLEYDIRLGAA